MDQQKVYNLKERLTITPRKVVDYDDSEVRPIKLFSAERDGYLGVPREFFLSMARQDHEIVDQTSSGHDLPEMESRISQTGDYEEQAVATEEFLKYIEETGRGGILQAAPAWGKTAWALEMILRLGSTALVVVNREFLMKQWMKRIKKFLPGARIGAVQQDVCEFEDRDIVIAMVHSLAKKLYPGEMYEYFGTVIFDEVHRVPAYTWSKVPPLFPAAHRIGLSATPRRKDGTEWVFKWHIGDVVFKASKSTNSPKVRRIYTGWILPQKLREKKLKMPTIIKMMVANKGRNQQIVNEILKAVRSPSKRKLLVLSDRLAHLERLKDMVLTDEDGNLRGDAPTMDFYVGGRKEEELDKAEEAQVIFATYQMAFEALDIEALDTVLFTTPRGDVEQSVGRIQRWCSPEEKKCSRLCPWRAGECKGKPQPIVVDFMDEDNECKGMAAARMRFYKSERYI